MNQVPLICVRKWQGFTETEQREIADWLRVNMGKWTWRNFEKDERSGNITMNVQFNEPQAAMWFKLKWGSR